MVPNDTKLRQIQEDVVIRVLDDKKEKNRAENL